MRWNGIYVSGVAAWLGRAEPVADAVADGRYDPGECAADGYESVRVAGVDEFPPDMAVAAARAAISRCADPGEMALVLHTGLGFTGLDHFAVASYVQRESVAGQVPAMEIRQSSNGQLAAVEMAAAYLSARRAPSAALITASDRFALPCYDRYRSETGMVLGDGAAALVLSTAGGVARLLSTNVLGDATYEQVYRGAARWGTSSRTEDWPIDLRRRKLDFFAETDELWEVLDLLHQRQAECVESALNDAGIRGDQIDVLVTANTGRTVQDRRLYTRIGVDESRTTWEWGRTVGHLGAADQVAGLAHLLECGAVKPADHVVLVGSGSGFSFGCAVLEIVSTVDWEPTAA